MLLITRKNLHAFLENGGKDGSPDELELNPLTFEALCKCDIKYIVAGSEMSENHLGGDDLVEVAHSTAEAIKEGYAVVCWYGHDCEALVAGYRPTELTVVTEETPE